MPAFKNFEHGRWVVRASFAKDKWNYTPRDKSEGAAEQLRLKLARTLERMEDDSLEVPQNLSHDEMREFIFTDGKRTQKPKILANSVSQLGQICLDYLAIIKKAPKTIAGEKIHLNHLRKFFDDSKLLASIEISDLQKYVDHRAKTVGPKTVGKELLTFTLLWKYARKHDLLTKDNPIFDANGEWNLEIDKPRERIPFQTYEQISKIVARGGLTKVEEKELWGSLFLNMEEIREVLEIIKINSRHPSIYPMSVCAAYSSARKSELLRSQQEDFDFEYGKFGRMKVREKKRKKKQSLSFRYIELHPFLRDVMLAHLAKHKSKYTFPSATGGEFNTDDCRYFFKKSLAKSKWKVVAGFHLFRHSFCSNCISLNVPLARLSKWTGDSISTLMEFYIHLVPEDGETWINKL